MIYVRIGDAGDYVELSCLSELLEELKANGVVGPFTFYNAYGVTAPGYEGNNYISVYYGTSVETPTKGLTAEELTAALAAAE